jgi:hypothetical protein
MNKSLVRLVMCHKCAEQMTRRTNSADFETFELSNWLCLRCGASVNVDIDLSPPLLPQQRIKNEGSRTTTGSPEWQPFADALLARLQLLQREVATGSEVFQAVLDCVNLIAKMTDHDAPQADIIEAVDAVATKSGVAHTTVWMMATQAFWMTAARMFAELPPVTGEDEK